MMIETPIHTSKKNCVDVVVSDVVCWGVYHNLEQSKNSNTLSHIFRWIEARTCCLGKAREGKLPFPFFWATWRKQSLQNQLFEQFPDTSLSPPSGLGNIWIVILNWIRNLLNSELEIWKIKFRIDQIQLTADEIQFWIEADSFGGRGLPSLPPSV